MIRDKWQLQPDEVKEIGYRLSQKFRHPLPLIMIVID